MSLRRRLSCAVIASVLVTALLGGRAAVSVQHDDRIAGSYIVVLSPRADPARSAADLSRAYGGRATHVYDAVVRGFSFAGSADAARRLAADRRVVRIDQDRAARLADDTPPVQANYLGVAPPTVSNARDNASYTRTKGLTYEGTGVRIAVLDTGVDSTHPVFHNRPGYPDTIVGTYGGCVGQTGAPDQNGHGTATASNAAGQMGVAHNGSVVAVKVFPGASSGTTWATIICGLNYVKSWNADPAKASQKISIVNMSITGGGIPSLATAVKQLTDSGVVVVAAAGNTGGGVGAPAAYPKVIAASALTQNGQGLASFSSRGSRVDLAAPGVNTYSASPGGAYTRRTGTSRSAPQIAGAVAVVLALNPAAVCCGASDARSILKSTGTCPDGHVNTGGNGPCGSSQGQWPGDTDHIAEPRINVYCAAVAAAAATPDPGECT